MSSSPRDTTDCTPRGQGQRRALCSHTEAGVESPCWPDSASRAGQSGNLLQQVSLASLAASRISQHRPTQIALPTATPLRADASTALPNSATSEVFVDPTTATLFPHRLTAPDGTPLRLVGTGVRTVSFLNIRVYTAAFYVSERELDALEQGTLGEDWIGFTPERLIAPHAIPSKDERAARPHGEALMETLLEKADAAVIISQLRPFCRMTPKPSY